MWPFEKTSQPTVDAPAPQEVVADRKTELLTQLSSIDDALAPLNREALALRTRYSLRVDRRLQITAMKADFMESQHVHTAWRSLHKRVTPLMTWRNQVQDDLRAFPGWMPDYVRLREQSHKGAA
jgi:hypothetical protein